MIGGRKVVTALLVVAFLCTVMASVAPAQQKTNVVVKEWRIPTIYFLRGPMAGFAEPHKWLADKLVADINAAGGIAGKPVVLEYCDSGLDPTKATACVAKAVDSGALCMNGPLNDMEMKASMAVASRARALPSRLGSSGRLLTVASSCVVPIWSLAKTVWPRARAWRCAAWNCSDGPT